MASSDYHTAQIRNNNWWPQYQVGSSDASTKWFGPHSEGLFITLVPGAYESIHDGGSRLSSSSFASSVASVWIIIRLVPMLLMKLVMDL